MGYGDHVVWERKSKRCIIQIITTPYWKPNYKIHGGIPINPNIPKWLVKIIDHFTHDEYCPTDYEFFLITSMLDKESLKLVAEAFKLKEEHNQVNLVNPEKRQKELVYRKLWEASFDC